MRYFFFKNILQLYINFTHSFVAIELLTFCKNAKAQALSVSVGNSYSEDQIMHIFLDNFQQSGKYSAQLASHQAEFRKRGKVS